VSITCQAVGKIIVGKMLRKLVPRHPHCTIMTRTNDVKEPGMAGEIIRLGDTTSHGGTVLEGSLTDICMGKPIAYMGHKVWCPKCKGTFPIVEGISNMTVFGHGVAVAGMKTACGALLVATQFIDTVEWHGERSRADTSKASGEETTGLAISCSGNSLLRMPFDEQIRLVDGTGRPLANVRYKIVAACGAVFEGATDRDGKAQRVRTSAAETLNVYLMG
jgi:uncharacterized Zn-binding protein involved in type VI secretion